MNFLVFLIFSACKVPTVETVTIEDLVCLSKEGNKDNRIKLVNNILKKAIIAAQSGYTSVTELINKDDVDFVTATLTQKGFPFLTIKTPPYLDNLVELNISWRAP